MAHCHGAAVLGGSAVLPRANSTRATLTSSFAFTSQVVLFTRPESCVPVLGALNDTVGDWFTGSVPPEGGVVPGASTLIAFTSKYCWSATIFRMRLPALSGTPLLPTHWKLLHEPVDGTATLPVTSTPSISARNAAPVEFLFAARIEMS